jgi:hypothetical protein
MRKLELVLKRLGQIGLDYEEDEGMLTEEELEMGLAEGVGLEPLGESRLEREFNVSNDPARPTDSLRLIDGEGVFWDIIPMPDSSIGVQELEMQVVYPEEKFNRYDSWEAAEEALPGTWSVHQVLTSTKPPVEEGAIAAGKRAYYDVLRMYAAPVVYRCASCCRS